MVLKEIDGFLNQDDIINYLNKNVDNSITEWNQIPSPFLFKNMDKAISIYKEALLNNTKIKIVHDSDADGLGTYLLSWYFYSSFYYKNVELIIVERSKGYGLIPEHIEDNCLIITADNGITAIDACKKAKTLSNCKVIITDHHQVDSFFGLPEADCIINPWLPDCDFPYKEINGTFVYWFFLNAVNLTFDFNYDMKSFLPELTLTTISDVMPLIHINRFIVKEGLTHLPKSERRWVKTFLISENLKEPNAEDLAFKIIPSINVTGRLTKADESAYFLIQEEHIASTQWLRYLNTLNKLRKKSQEDLFKFIELNYSQWLKEKFIIIPGMDKNIFKKGLLGPTAGRLAEKYNKPTIVLVLNNGVFSGSGRSVGSIDILSIIKENSFVIQEKTGGHKAACGVSFNEAQLNNVLNHCREKINLISEKEFESCFTILGKLNIRDITTDLYNAIKNFEPFGEGFKRPEFSIRGVAKDIKKLGKDGTHLSFYLHDGLGSKIKCLYFFATDEIKANKMYNVICNIQYDNFNGADNTCLYVKKLVDLLQ